LWLLVLFLLGPSLFFNSSLVKKVSKIEEHGDDDEDENVLETVVNPEGLVIVLQVLLNGHLESGFHGIVLILDAYLEETDS
jgi:hypothetical protein